MIKITEKTQFPIFGKREQKNGVISVFKITKEKNCIETHKCSIYVFYTGESLEVTYNYDVRANTYDDELAVQIDEVAFLKLLNEIQIKADVTFSIK